MTYVLFIILLFVLLVCVYLKEKDIFSPLFLSLIAFLVSFIFAFIGTFSWNTQSELSYTIIGIFIIGIFGFIIGSIIAKKYYLKKNCSINKSSKIKKIKIERWKIILSCIFIIATIILMILEIKRICSFFGYDSNNLANLLSYYRSKTILYSNEISSKTTDINFVIRQMHKTTVIIGVLFIYAFCNNFFQSKKDYRLILPVILSMCESLLTSGRSLFMRLVLIFILCFLYFKVKRDGKINIKTIFTCVISIIVVLIVFYIMLPLLGRNNDISFVRYITFYFSCGIPSFDLFLANLPEHIGYIGEETFTGIYVLLNKMHILEFARISSYGWETIGGMHSNVYTALKAYYFDFGFFGVGILQILFGFLSTLFYNYAKKSKNIIFMIIFFYYIYIFFEQIRAEQFYALISSTTLSHLLIIFFMYYFLYIYNKKDNRKLLNRLLKTIRRE